MEETAVSSRRPQRKVITVHLNEYLLVNMVNKRFHMITIYRATNEEEKR